MKKLLIVLLIFIGALAGIYFKALPIGFHKVVHEGIKKAHSENLNQESDANFIYQHKINEDGTESSILKKETIKYTITSVPEFNFLKSHIDVDIYFVKKDTHLRFKVSILSKFNEKLHILLSFEDFNKTNKKDGSSVSLVSPSIIISVPFEAFKPEDKPDLIEIIAKSKLELNLKKFNIQTKDESVKFWVSDIVQKTYFKEKAEGFSSVITNFNVKKIEVSEKIKNDLFGAKIVKNLSQKFVIDSFHRKTIKRMIDILMGKDPKNKMGNMALMGEVGNLLPKDGGSISINTSVITHEKQSSFQGVVKIPMPIMMVMTSGPEINAEGKFYKRIIPFFVRPYLSELTAKQLAKIYQFKDNPRPFKSSGNPALDRLKRKQYERKLTQKKQEKIVSLLENQYFSVARLNTIVVKLTELGFFVKEDEFYKFQATYKKRNLLINGKTIENSLFADQSIINQKEIDQILQSNGFQLKSI